MKKFTLIIGIFSLLGTSFVMANEIAEVKTEKTTKIVVDGSVLVITRVYGCNGELLGTTSGHVDCENCEGANIKVVSTTYCPANDKDEPAPGY